MAGRGNTPRWPIVSIALAAATTAAFGLGPARVPAGEQPALTAALETWRALPGLPLPAPLAPLVAPGPRRPSRDRSRALDLAARHALQKELDARVARAVEASRASPRARFGVVPEDGLFQVGWLLAPLNHRSWASWLVGLVALAAAAVPVERRRRRGLLVVAFVVGGLTAPGVTALLEPGSTRAVAGGPGAVAACGALFALVFGPRARPIPGWTWPAVALGVVAALRFGPGGVTTAELWGWLAAWGAGAAVAGGAFVFDRRRPGPRLSSNVAGGLTAALVLLAGGALCVATSRPPLPDPTPLEIASVPRGARIQVDGTPLSSTTPAKQLVAPGRVYRIEVDREGHFAQPPHRYVLGSPDVERVTFRLFPRSDIDVTTEPSGAVVSLDGRRVGQAPLRLPPLRRDSAHTLTVEALGHLPKTLELSTDEPQRTVEVVLEPSVRIEVASSPSPAHVVLEDRRIAETPAWIEVPSQRRFVLRIERPGYHPARRRLDGRRLRPDQSLTFALEPLPITELPLTPEERGEVDRLRADLGRAKLRLSRTKMLHGRAREELGRSGRRSVHEAARLDRLVDSMADRITELETTVEDLEGQLEGIRGVVSRRAQP